MKRLKIIGLIIAALVAVAVIIAIVWPKEPAYQGKTLTEWLDDFHHQKFMSMLHYQGEERAAIAAMGTNALPFLLRWVATREGTLRAKVIDLVNGQKLVRTHLKTAKEKHLDAWDGFVFLGSNALPAVPKLIKLTHDKDTSVRHFADLCCSEICYPERGPLLAALENCLKDSDAELRRGAAELLRAHFPTDAGRLGVYTTFPDLKPIADNGVATNWGAGTEGIR